MGKRPNNVPAVIDAAIEDDRQPPFQRIGNAQIT
jgi:hypothetical protein